MINLITGLLLACLSTQLHSQVESLNRAKELLQLSPKGLIHLFKGRKPVLFVHGIDFEVKDWLRPLELSLSKNRETYFYRFSKYDSLLATGKNLRKSIVEILEQHPQEDLLIMAHSMGGIVSLLALDTFMPGKYEKRIKIHTIASPGFGYGAPPRMAYVLAPIIGIGTVQMGIGAYQRLRNNFTNQCHHWITINCELDEHACNRGDLNPQTGNLNDPARLPCGEENATYLDDEDHRTVIIRVVEELLH